MMSSTYLVLQQMTLHYLQRGIINKNTFLRLGVKEEGLANYTLPCAFFSTITSSTHTLYVRVIQINGWIIIYGNVDNQALNARV